MASHINAVISSGRRTTDRDRYDSDVRKKYQQRKELQVQAESLTRSDPVLTSAGKEQKQESKPAQTIPAAQTNVTGSATARSKKVMSRNAAPNQITQNGTSDPLDRTITETESKIASKKAEKEQAIKRAYDQSFEVTGIAVDLNPKYGQATKQAAVAADELKQLEKEYSLLLQEKRRSERTKETERYFSFMNNPDFMELSQEGAAIPNPSFSDAEWGLFIGDRHYGGEDVHNIVTYSRDNKEKLQTSEGKTVGDYRYSYMTDDEVAVYNYLLARDGGDSAQEYLDFLEEDLNYRIGTETGENIRDIENAGGRAALTGLYALSSGVERWGGDVKQFFAKDQLPTSPTQYASQYIRNDLADTGPQVFGQSLGQLGYDAANTVGYMAPSISVSKFAGALGAPTALAQGVGATTMGVASAGSAYQQALAQGHSQESARTYSLLVGAAEGGLQYMLGGVKPLGGTASEQVLKKISSLDNALLRVSLNGAVKIGSEVTEEEIQLLLEPVLRSLILKEDFSAPTFEDAAYTAILTALTTAPLNAGSSHTNTNTRPTTTTETDYTPYLEQLKQLKKDKQQHTQWLASIGAQDTTLSTLAKYEKAKYNNSPEYLLLKQYAADVESGWITPLSGFENYKTLYNRVQDEIIGQTTAGGITLKGQVPHFMQRIIGTTIDPKIQRENLRIIRRSGVEVECIKEAIFTPEDVGEILVRSNGRRSVKYVGKNCVVSINPDTGELIQTNPLGG